MITSKFGHKPLITPPLNSSHSGTTYKRTPPKGKKAKSNHTKPERPTFSLDTPARVRVKHWLALLSIGHSTFYEGMQSGRYPKPDAYDGKIPYWRTSTVREFLEG